MLVSIGRNIDLKLLLLIVEIIGHVPTQSAVNNVYVWQRRVQS
jgi:hypothetical protein